MTDVEKLVRELIKNGRECEWLEVKVNKRDSRQIGEDISALANGAALNDRPKAYMIWGVDDDMKIKGTYFDPQKEKVGNENLVNWLRQNLSRNASFEFESGLAAGVNVVVLTIGRAELFPVSFYGREYVKDGSYTKHLLNIPVLAGKLWGKLSTGDFESGTAKEDLTAADVLELLDFVSFFELAGIPLPGDQKSIVKRLIDEGFVIEQSDGRYSVTNLGALAFAKRLSAFGKERKAVRVVRYEGRRGAGKILKDSIFDKGYANGFKELMMFIEALLPSEYDMSETQRRTVTAYPASSVKEVVANSLIHQDLSVTNMRNLVEIFDSRMEVSNPGAPLIDVDRIIDTKPITRNEKLSSLMRRIGLAEGLGTGWDRIVEGCERLHAPPPDVRSETGYTLVILRPAMGFEDMTYVEKLRACYQHACVRYLNGGSMTNASLRERFGLGSTMTASVSRIIKRAVDKGVIKAHGPDTSPKYMSYVPFWG